MRENAVKNIEDVLALTPMQEGMLFHYLKEPRGDYYVEQLCLDISGEIDKGLFEKTWNIVIQTNEMMRTFFRWEKVKQPAQVILKEHRLNFEYYDLSTTKEGAGKERQKEKIKEEDRNKGFDLREVPFRVTLCKTAENDYCMIIGNHHILYDGWSAGIILKEFFQVYAALKKGAASIKPPLKPRFKEFVKWLHRQDENKRDKYWKKYLEGFDSRVELPIKIRKKGEKQEIEDYAVRLEADIKEQAAVFIKKNRLTPASFFYTAWGILLQRYVNNSDVLFGTTVSGRPAGIKGIENMVGLFINTVPLRVRTEGGESEKIIDRLHKIYNGLKIRERYESTSLVDIRACSELPGSEELFDSILVIENYPVAPELMRENNQLPLTIRSFSAAEATNYDLTVFITMGEDIEIRFNYDNAIIEKESILRLAGHFINIIKGILKYPGKAVSSLEILSKEEKARVLYEFNDTAVDYPKDKTIHQLFEEQAIKRPDNTALVGTKLHITGALTKMPPAARGSFEKPPLDPTKLLFSYKTGVITYRELNQKSGQLAHLLRTRGVEADSVAGLSIDRSIEMIIGIMGILKAGGAYLPIDPDYPEERKQYMLKDSGARLLLTTFPENSSCPSCPSWFPSTPKATSSTYVIYTSGSTGKPKGVMITHRSVVNFIKGITDIIPFTTSGSILSLTTISFDIFGLETLLPLACGSRVVIGGREEQMNPGAASLVMQREKITHFQATPSRLQLFVQDKEAVKGLRGLKYLLVGGEPFPPALLQEVREITKGKIYNVYGPTETTIWSTIKDLTGNVPLNIGRPLCNTYIYILSRTGAVQPIGVPGELYIAGDGLAKGYLNKPELTTYKFCKNFSLDKSFVGGAGGRFFKRAPLPAGGQVYKTGDLARWLLDGNIEFLGRMDFQVKIRGFRVELGEIESRLLGFENIKEAVVLVNEHENLCAFVVSRKTFLVEELREYLAKKLPPYMVPQHFTRVDNIPLTPSGKVDRKSLQTSGKRVKTSAAYTPPKNDIEKTIAGIWKELLGQDKAGIHDNFFDSGGNSLLMIRLNSRLKGAFNKDIPMVDLFNHPTIASLARHLSEKEEKNIKKDRTGEVRREVKEIAVIGMACCFPGAKNYEEFRENLQKGIESIGFLSAGELEELGVESVLRDDAHYIPAKGMLEDKHYFDSFFFGYTPAEAKIMDPQIRVFHECCWGALEDAGYDPGNYDGVIGLYAGASQNPFWEILPLRSKTFSYSESWDAIQFSAKDYLSTRVAYALNLKGPCVTLQTACSTSLVAVDQACRGLVSGACDMALAGGVSITLQDESGYLYQEGTIMSPDGHCRAFDAEAKGTVGGNGVGVVVLKGLRQAEGDTILAVIKGFGINNDGKDKVGFTAPSSEGQAKAIGAAMDMAGAAPATIGFIEAHGTGTPLGDPIEIEGLKMAFGTNAEKKNYCALGSVKTNIGHLDAAAGIAGLIKTVLSLKHRCIFPGLNFKSPNPGIALADGPFYVNTRFKCWESAGFPRRAGVSSFGLGGTNVHVLLEEYLKGDNFNHEGHEGHEAYRFILLSAKTETALDKITINLAEYFKKHPFINLSDAAYTLQVGRGGGPYRRMAVCRDINEAIGKLETGEVETGFANEKNPTVIFMFSGQGSQYVNMGLDLYKGEAVFRKQVDRCFQLLEHITSENMKPILYPVQNPSPCETKVLRGVQGGGFSKEPPCPPEAKIYQFHYTTPIKFIFEYSLAKLLINRGIRPDAMIGHSFGEYTAACLAGVFSLEDALFMAALRGRLMHRLPDGAMLSVPLSEKQLEPLIDSNDRLSLAAVNGESLCVVSGDTAAIDRLEIELNKKGHECLRYRVPKAGHSWMVESIMGEFREKIAKVIFNEPRIPYVSGMSGTWVGAGEVTNVDYWTRHLRAAVRFADGLTTLFKEPNPIFLQVGPGRGLTLFVNQHPDKKPAIPALNMVRHRNEGVSDIFYTLNQVGRLWLNGLKIHWPSFHDVKKRHRIPLPTYPFEGKYYPVDKNLFTLAVGASDFSKEPELKKKPNISEWFYVPIWQQSIPLNKSFTGGAGGRFFKRAPLPAGGKTYVLLFTDRHGLGRRLRPYLEEELEVIEVERGVDIGELLIKLKKQGREPGHIYHLWGIDGWEAGQGIEDVLDSVFFSLLFLVQALEKYGIGIDVVTAGALEVTGEEQLCPVKAAVYGLCKVIPQEYPHIRCRCIDITLPGGEFQKEKRVRQLAAEFSSASRDRVAAYRGDYRWVQAFKPLRLEKPSPGAVPLKQGGVYLITGGTGAIGLVLAAHLAKSYKAGLILTSRSQLPARRDWKRRLSVDAGAGPLNEKIRKLLEIEALGSEVLVLSADVSDLGRMRAVFKQGEEKFGGIDGVIHAAGIVGEKAFTAVKDIGKAEVDLHFRPKVHGLLVLEEVLKNKTVDFCLLMSSTSSVLGGLGFGAYAAANFFMDAYIHKLNRSGRTRWLSIDWDGWQLEGQSFGDTPLGSVIAELAMTPAEGAEVFERVLGHENINRVIQCSGDLQTRIDRWIKLEPLKQPGQPAVSLLQARPPLPNAYAAPRNPLEEELADIWKHLLGYERIGIHDNFFQLNGDSLKAVLGIAKIHKQLNIKIPLEDFFTDPTIEGLARFITETKESESDYFSIRPVEEKEYYPLSSAQRQMYLLHQYDKESTAYNIPQVMELEGRPEIKKIKEIFLRLIHRHESLRTSFEMKAEEPVQRIHGEVEFDLDLQDLQDFQRQFIRPFDLSRAPLLRVGLVQLDKKKHLLVVDMHHIVSDGTSMTILLKEFMRLYKGETLSLPFVRFRDYVCFQGAEKGGERIKRQEAYWLKELEGELPVLDLPYDFSRPKAWSFEGGRYCFQLGADETEGLKELAKAKDVTSYMVLVSLYTVLLAKLTGGEEVVIGAPTAGRRHADLQGMIGMFVNPLVLRCFPVGAKPYAHYLMELKTKVLAAFENQDYPFEELAAHKASHREVGRNPLFDAAFVFQNMEIPAIEIPGLTLKPLAVENPAAKLDLALIAEEIEGGLRFTFEYSTAVFRPETIEALGTYFKNAAGAVLENPERKITDIEITGKEEKLKILREFNGTNTGIPENKCIHHMFEEQAEKTPDSIAVTGQGGNHEGHEGHKEIIDISYKGLNERSRGLAFLLKAKGVRADTIVGIIVERSIEMIAGILGILKAGGAYMPIDPAYPKERRQFMVKDSGAQVLSTLFENSSCPSCPSWFPPTTGTSLAYVIYTSGSTGKPKGVMIQHHSVFNTIYWRKNEYRLGPGDKVLQLFSFAFDGSVTAFFTPIVCGSRAVLPSEAETGDPEALASLILSHYITHFICVPSLYALLLENIPLNALTSLKTVTLAGETLAAQVIEKNQRFYPYPELVNEYGATENSVVTTFCRDAAKAPPGCIGKPIANTQAYIVDKSGHLLPTGVPGELYVSGKGLARGYLNRPELTKQKYRSYKSYMTYIFKKIYKTGDLTRWLPGGNIEFLGRIDQQVKIRGFRIELGEIETQLKKWHRIKEAVAVIKERQDKYLCAYIVSDVKIEITELWEYLSQSLPDYMIPAYVVNLDRLPLLPNGKINRNALPEPELSTDEYENLAPGNRNPVEKKLVEIWSEVLNKTIGIDDNFFLSGGHSLKASILKTRIHKGLNVNVPLAEIFKTPTVRKLAEYITGKAAGLKYISLEKSEEKEYYPLSSAQKRLYIHQNLDKQSTLYNTPSIFLLSGNIETERLEDTFDKLMARHGSFRTSFEIIDEEPVQRLHRANYKLKIATSNPPAGHPVKITNIIETFIRPFNLEQAPLLRVELVKTGKCEYLFMVDMHHIISDVVSITIFVNEFCTLYEGAELPGLKIQYNDYSEWERKQTYKEELSWLEQFSEGVPRLDLRTDFPRPAVQRTEGRVSRFELDSETTEALKQMALEQGCSLYMVLLAIYTIMLSRLSGKEKIVAGTAAAGRRHADLEPIIGIFINTLALINYPLGEKTFNNYLSEVKERTLAAFENQDYPFDELVKQVAENRKADRHPIFDVMFAMQDDVEAALTLEGLTLTPYDPGFIQSKVDLALVGMEKEGKLHFVFQYCTALFKKETIQRYAKYFNRIAAAVTAGKHNELPLSGINILSEEERKLLLDLFNDTRSPYPADKTIPRLFEQQVQKTPDKTAVVFEHAALTYKELNRLSNRLARILRKKGAAKDSIVGLSMGRSLEMMTGIMAILKAGGAYLPIDPAFPQERVVFMLKDCGAPLLLAGKKEIEKYSFTGLQNLQEVKTAPEFTSPRAQVIEFDALPLPDRSMVDYEKYSRYIGQGMVKNSITIQATRGCPYHCAYCCRVWPKKYVTRSARHIFEEVKLYYNMGVRRFVFIDDIFNLDIPNSREFFQLIIKNGLKVQFLFPSGLRGDILTKDYIDLMAEAGVISFPLALETASPRLQKLIRKNLNIEKLRENLAYILDKHPRVILELHTMHGFPTETEAEAVMTLDFIKSFKTLHFPYIHILKIHANTEMEQLAVENGISPAAIARSQNLAYHQLPDTLPFEKSFTLRCQADFLNHYFLSKERLLHVLPFQMKTLTENEMVQKYNSYLPVDINSFEDLLQFTGISREALGGRGCVDEEALRVSGLNRKIAKHFQKQRPGKKALKILLLDLSQLFSSGTRELYDVVEQPLGLMYLTAYLHRRFGNAVCPRIAKSRVDFDSYDELNVLVKEFQPDVIGLRTLTIYKDFFHKTAAMIRHWGVQCPIIAGGPYATTDTRTLLQDGNIDLAVLGEGEITFAEVIQKIMDHNAGLPGPGVLKQIAGIAFIAAANQRGIEILMPDVPVMAESTADLEPVNDSSGLAYVIYTSGSTGKPKGILTSHANAVRVVKNTNYIDLKESDNVLQLSNYAFDGSVFDIYGALLNGSKLVMMKHDDLLMLDRLSTVIEKENIDVFFVTTAMFNTLVDIGIYCFRNVRKVLFGGERVSMEHVGKACQYMGKNRLLHMYGPTETTVYATYYNITEIENNINTIPIGKPLANTAVYVLDKYLNLTPIGAPGEIYIGGPGLARGYLNHPGLTKKKFLCLRRAGGSFEKPPPAPPQNFCFNQKFLRGVQGGGFFKMSPPARRRHIYKTGDVGRWLSGGDIEFIGRIDEQVKIRGFRIEPEEIETHLSKHHHVKGVVVLTKENRQGDKYLCAYVVSGSGIQVSELKEFLSMDLPGYMIPSYFVLLDKMPLTANGKIDRKALPEPGIERREDYTAPRDKTEKKLAVVWAGVLSGGDPVNASPGPGIDADFFESGGHSLKATLLAAKIHKAFHVNIPLSRVFANPTIRGLAAYIKEAAQERYVSLQPTELKEYYTLSSPQKRLYVLQQMDEQGAGIAYNIPFAAMLTGTVDKERFEHTFKKLIQRHESLRTFFETVDGEPVQRVLQEAEFEMEFCLTAKTREGARRKKEGFVRHFDLSRAPLLRVGLFKENDNRHIFIVDMHHIISDGVSMGVLVNEFMTFYGGEELNPLNIQYKDFAAWQNSGKVKETLKTQEEYWRNQFKGDIPVLNLPCDYVRPVVQSFAGESLLFGIELENTRALKDLASEKGTTLYMVLSAIFNVFLAKITNRESVVIGTVVAGRRHADLEQIIGMFVNTLGLTAYPLGQKCFAEFLEEVNEETLAAFETLIRQIGFVFPPFPATIFLEMQV